MSTLRVGNLTATGGTGTITVPTGNTISQVDTPDGLVLIKKENIGTAVSSVTLDSVFSSTYDNYRILVQVGSDTSGNTQYRIQYKTASTTTTTNYASILWTPYVDYASGSSVGVSATGHVIPTYQHGSSANGSIDVINPNKATTTVTYGNYSTTTNAGITASKQTDTTQFTGFTFSTSAGTMTGGFVAVYGYRQ